MKFVLYLSGLDNDSAVFGGPDDQPGTLATVVISKDHWVASGRPNKIDLTVGDV